METPRNRFTVLLIAFARMQRHPLFRPAAAGLALAIASVAYPELLIAVPIVFGTTLTEGAHAGEFLAWEAGASFMREQVTVLSGQDLSAGAVVGRVNKGVGGLAIPAVVGTGNGVATVVFTGPDVIVGSYVVTLITAAANNGTFSVVNPAGKALPNAVMAAGSVVYRSREINFTITDGSTDFIVGDVFTFVVSTTAPLVVGTGNGVISAITFGPDAKPGNYRFEITATITNGGEFKLTGPDGDLIDQGFIVAGSGGTYVGGNKRQINFTVTEGSTDFVIGDAFNIAAFNQITGGKVVAWDPTAVDGRDDVAGILLDNIDATLADTAGVLVVRDAVVVKSSLVWGAAITAAQKESAYAQLAANHVIARDGVTQ